MKTRESNFQKSDVPNLQSAALFNWEMIYGEMEDDQESSIMHIEEATYLNNASRISFIHDIAEVWFLLAAKQGITLQTAISSQAKSIGFISNA